MRPRILGRHKGLARGFYNNLVADDRFSGKQVLAEAQWRLNTLISVGGYSACQLVFGPNPAAPIGWGDKDEDSLFARDTPLSGQFAQQRQSRMKAQVAALREVAESKLRRPLAQNKSFNCRDVRIGG